MDATAQGSRQSLVVFFAVTYAITWTCFFATARLAGPSGQPHGFATAVLLTGVFAPGIVALSMTAIESGWPGVAALLRRLIEWRVPLRWYLFAAGYMAVVKLTVAVLLRVVTGAWPRFGPTPWYLMAAATIVSLLVGGQAGEEIGWRGYALPRLAERIGFARASVLLGVLWACWHLPLFFVLGGDTSGQSFPVYLLQVTALSVAMAWLYVRASGSLLLTMLMHAAINNTKDIVPSALTGAHNPLALSASSVAWTTAALLWIGSGYFLFAMQRPKTSSTTAVPAAADLVWKRLP